MSKMNNWMMDIEDFCDGYFYGGMNDFTIDRRYMKKQMGEM